MRPWRSSSGPAAYLIERRDGQTVALPGPAEQAQEKQAAPHPPQPEAVAAWLSKLTDPWLGGCSTLNEDRLNQLPVALRRLEVADATLIAAGATQLEATVSAVLRLARAQAGAAGLTMRTAVLDGALRELVNHLGIRRPPGSPSPELSRILRALPVQTELTVTQVQGISWQVGFALLPDGRRVCAWGPDEDTACEAAARQAVALSTDATETTDDISTDALNGVSTTTLSALEIEIATWLTARGLSISAHRGADDPLLGRAPLWAGRVAVVTSPEVTPQTAGLPALEMAVAELTPGTRQLVISGWQPELIAEAMASTSPVTVVRLEGDCVVIGPNWASGRTSGCAGCAEVRRRLVSGHALADDITKPTARPLPTPDHLLELATETALTSPPLAPGELLSVGVEGISRHQIRRHPMCPWCAPPPADQPKSLNLDFAELSEGDCTRVRCGTALLREPFAVGTVDASYGPVRGVVREHLAPFAMSMAAIAGSPVLGHGRASTFEQTQAVAVLEGFERLAGFPFSAPLVIDTRYQEVSDHAVDPRLLGRYHPSQLAHPSSKVTTFDPERPIDWTWGVELGSGAALLVPAEIGFYQYDYTFKRDVLRSRATSGRAKRRCFLESSSGCAVGSGVAEATVHALFEVAERDAFQVAWHRARPLPRIPESQLQDPVLQQLLELVKGRGYDVNFLVASQDIELPVIWVLATSRLGVFPASFSSAGSGADPVAAARSGLREVAQLVTMQWDWTAADADRLVEDPWQVRDLADHVRYSTSTKSFDRVRSVLGGPEVSPAEVYADWPARLTPDSGDILGTLELVRELFAAAGLEQIVVVDQSTIEHRDQGIAVVKAVVPGSIPMCFGQAHQRLLGIPRLERLVRPAGSLGNGWAFDPHPFP